MRPFRRKLGAKEEDDELGVATPVTTTIEERQQRPRPRQQPRP
jgi:hypothetical protein